MMDKTNNTNDGCLLYRSPEVNVINADVKGVLCQSGNESLVWQDLGDGGFEEQ